MSTDDTRRDGSSSSNNKTDRTESTDSKESRDSRAPGFKRRRRRAPRNDGGGDKDGDSQSRQVEEQSLGPGRKKRIFKRRRRPGESESPKTDGASDSGESSKRTRRNRGENRNRNRNGEENASSGGNDRGSSRSRNRNDSRRAERGRTRSRGNENNATNRSAGRERDRNRNDRNDRSRNDRRRQKRNQSGRNQNDLQVQVPEAPDGVFTGEMYTDLDSRKSSNRGGAAFPEEVVATDVSFFSSEKGQDFSSMTDAEIDFLKPHDADEYEMYVDMPALDADVKTKGSLMDIVGVKTHRSGSIDPFDCEDLIMEKGDEVIVETERGLAIGEVMVPTTRRWVSREIPRVFRAATKNDMRQRERNAQKAAEAFSMCQKAIVELKLDMKLVEVMYLHGGNKAVFYFMAEGRVDFRQLVKDLARELHIRVEMRQIGVRDASRMIGGLGTCGYALCCSRYIREFAPVSIRMAKDQDLVLNPEKVSGQCGRLLCCLAYEEDVYKEKGKKMPRVGKIVETPEGCGRVRDRDILRGLVRVQLETEHGLKTYEITDIRPVKKNNDSNRNSDNSERETRDSARQGDSRGENRPRRGDRSRDDKNRNVDGDRRSRNDSGGSNEEDESKKNNDETVNPADVPPKNE